MGRKALKDRERKLKFKDQEEFEKNNPTDPSLDNEENDPPGLPETKQSLEDPTKYHVLVPMTSKDVISTYDNEERLDSPSLPPGLSLSNVDSVEESIMKNQNDDGIGFETGSPTKEYPDSPTSEFPEPPGI